MSKGDGRKDIRGTGSKIDRAREGEKGRWIYMMKKQRGSGERRTAMVYESESGERYLGIRLALPQNEDHETERVGLPFWE
jgi:hypothetical protein